MKNGPENSGSPFSLEEWREKKFNPEVIKLFERQEQGDPNVETVGMDDGRIIEVMADDKDEKILWTYGLGGCYGTLVFTEGKDGRRNAALTHYDATRISENMAKIRELLGSSEAMKGAATKQMVVVMGSGEWVQDPKTKRYKLKPAPDSQKDIDAIILAIQTELGEDIQVHFEPYDTNALSGEKDRGVMIVTIPPHDKGDARYRTWFSGGKLGWRGSLR